VIHNSPLQFDTRGLEKFSLVEWPGKIAAIIFTGGCNFRCPFCHNPELVDGLNKTPPYPWKEIEKFLDKKKGWVDAIMITGGEPTIHADLPKILRIIKNKGYLTGIATNGSNPEMLREIIEKKLIDRICMDVKSSLDKYEEVHGTPILSSSGDPALREGRGEVRGSRNNSPGSRLPVSKHGAGSGQDDNQSNGSIVEEIKRSIELIKGGGVEYEFKLTIVPGIVAKKDIPKIGELIKGVKKLVLQQFRPQKTLDKSYQSKVPYCRDEIIEMAKELEKYVEEVDTSFIE